MTNDFSDNPTTSAAQRFALHAPSAAWEPIVVACSPDRTVWGWFRPPQMPRGVIYRLPPETWHANLGMPPLTLRHLIQAIDVEAAEVVAWYHYGVPYGAMSESAPYLDQPIPPPMPGLEPEIAFVIGEMPVLPITANSPDVAIEGTPSAELAVLFETIESDWTSTVKMERQMLLVRKQLASMMNRLNTLNRDLSPDERMYGDRQDKSDWQDARRSLRDAGARLSRCIKQHDVGETSMAGKRDWFEEIIQQIIEPRRPVENLPQLQREFEANRKRFQSLLNTMLSSLAEASQDGERRATSILSRLAVKVRQGLTPKPRS